MNEPVVFLPGLMADARVFLPQLAVLSGSRPVHVAPVATARTIEMIAAQVVETAPPKFALVGHGLGGVVALDVVRRAARRMTRLALVGTSPLPETPDTASGREPRIAAAKAGRLDDVMRDEIAIAGLADGPGRLDVTHMMMTMARDLGPDVFVRQSRALQRRPDQQAVLRALQLPTLILCGRHDRVTPVKRHEFMAGLVAGASFEVIENAGHLPMLEAPEETTAALERWLSGTLLLT
ncbi:MAG: alpha/beta hydrolase [Pseudomonadota bacterium]